MSLLQGKTMVGHNIEEMQKEGHPHKVAVAAAMNTLYGKKGKKKKKK